MPPLATSNLPALRRRSPGERAALVAEQLALEQLLGQRRAVHLHEPVVAAVRQLVRGARDDLLAHAALAVDQDRDVGVGDLLEDLLDPGHLLAGPQESRALARLDLAQPVAQVLALALQVLDLEHLLERDLELFFLEGLVDVVGRAEVHGVDHGARLADDGQHDHGHLGQELLDLAERLDAVDARHHDVEHDHVGPRAAVQELHRLEAVLGEQDVVALHGQQILQVGADHLRVVDDHDRLALRNGARDPGSPHRSLPFAAPGKVTRKSP